MKVAVVIPTQKTELTKYELKTIENLEQKLPGVDKYCITPLSVENESIHELWKEKANHYFLQYDNWNGTLREYNKMCLSSSLYDKFIDYDYILIHQTDALILGTEEELTYFCDLGYDYIGAPFGNEEGDGYWVSRHLFPERYIDYIKKKVGYTKKLAVGNGGICLRRVSSTISVLDKYKNKIPHWFEDAYEDIVLSWLATYDRTYKVAPVDVAIKFAKDQHMCDINNPSFAVHGKFILTDYFWENYINDLC